MNWNNLIDSLTNVLRGDSEVSVSVSVDTMSVVKACLVVLVMLLVFLTIKKLV